MDFVIIDEPSGPHCMSDSERKAWADVRYFKEKLTAATARADALLLALEAARHEMICAAASGCVRLECVDKALAEARKETP